VLVEDLGDPYTARVVHAMHREAVTRDVSLSFFVGGQVGIDRMRNDAFAVVSPEAVDALVVLAVARRYSPEEMAEILARFRPLPICTIGVRCPGLPCVQVDNEPAMRAALDHLVRHHGRRRVLFLRGPKGNTEANTRFAIYRDVLRRQDIRWDPALVVQGDFDAHSAERAVTDYVRTRGTDFDAIMAGNDAMALGALRALERAGVRVPENLSLVGFDDIEAAWSSSPPLSTVRQPFDEIASTSFEVVLGESPGNGELKTVTGELVLRRSCGCVSRAVERAGAVLGSRTAQSLEHAAGVATAAAERWLLRSGAMPHHAGELVAALVRQGAQGRGVFFSLLERTIADLMRGGTPVRHLQELLTELSAALRPALLDAPTERENVELALQQARILIADAAEREAASRAQVVQGHADALITAARALLPAFDLVALRRAIRLELPRLGVPGCCVLLYDDAELSQAPRGSGVSTLPPGGAAAPAAKALEIFVPEHSRCLLAYEPTLAASSSPEEDRVQTRGLWPSQRTARTTQTVQSLFFDAERLGLLVLDFVPGHGALHQAVAEMVSAALQGAKLARRVAEEAARRERVERQRLEQELEIAARIQSSILPRNVSVEGLEVVAAMEPATEVGGDYYDVLPFAGGAWIGIGDVAGHGLRPGIVMVMLQSVVAAVAALAPQTRPRDLIHVVNQVLYDNVRGRLEQDEHATLSVIRYQRDGTLSFAGAHEDLIIWRAATGRCELIPTDGTWVAATRDIDAVTHDHQARLEPEDILVLYTDGAIEAKNDLGERFGMPRLIALLEEHGRRPVAQIRDQVLTELRSFAPERDDDVALLVARFRP
jgi:DNA-binding LacI/PurR family transcriptional regulator/serine phosphatase RsbU (regulator of sigma subunit)